MPELTIRLRVDPTTGKKDILVDLKSDDDALPHEHEQLHRALVQKLIEGGVLKAEELGQVIVEREAESGRVAGPASAPPAEERRSQAEGQG